MESWQDFNYKTRDQAVWVRFMNISTADWNIGSLPPNIFAITGSLNETHKFPAKALVIQHVGKTQLGQSEIEVAVFGIASGLVIFCACLWIYFNRQSFLEPDPGLRAAAYNPVQQTDAEIASTDNTLVSTVNETVVVPGSGLTVAEFRRLLDTRYYEPVDTEAELYEKQEYDDTEAPEPLEVEALTTLMRKVYELDLLHWAYQNARNRREEDQQALRDRSDAAWAEVRGTVEGWQRSSAGQFRPDERRQLEDIMGIVSRIPARRYG